MQVYIIKIVWGAEAYEVKNQIYLTKTIITSYLSGISVKNVC